MATELRLDRDLMHTQFSSWRLSPVASVTRHALSATGHASGVISTSLDFLHTHVSVLRNHLLQSEGRVFVYTQSERRPGQLLLYELLPAPASDAGLLPQEVAELSPEPDEPSAVEAVVDCSLALVARPSKDPTADTSTSAAATATATAAAAAAEDEDEELLLLSRGHGDVVLARRWGGGRHVSYSNAVYPLRPPAPLAGVRPLVLEVAYGGPGGDVTAVAWAMRSRGPRPHEAACCEVFAITLRPTPVDAPADASGGSGGSGGGSGGAVQLAVVCVQLLRRTRLPPHLVRVDPPPAAPPHADGATAPGGCREGGRLLMAYDPTGVEDEEAEAAPTAPAADKQPAAAAAPAAAQAAKGGGGAMADVDDAEGDDVDPRTLEAAAARLAHMTSEERSGPGPAQQWADVYHEAGPDGVGAMGGEPAVEAAAWRLPALQGAPAGAAEGGLRERAGPPAWRVACGAHRLLTADGPCRAAAAPAATAGAIGPHAPPPPPLPPLLGLTDDVDCAVVALAWGDGGAAQPEVAHVVSIPALSYVVAGKTHKRHLLLATPAPLAAAGPAAAGGAGGGSGGKGGGAGASGGGGGLAAVLVEDQRFMYLYGAASTRDEYGRQQVVDLGLGEGESVLGARLLELGPAGGRAAGGVAVVVVATQRRLLSYRLALK